MDDFVGRRALHGGSSAAAPEPGATLFRRLLLLNAGVLVGGATLLVLTPATVSRQVAIAEVTVLIVGLAVMVVVNAGLVRASLRPLDRLTAFMPAVDMLRPGERLPVRGSGYVARIVQAFNDMLDRLESERSASRAHVLAAQEGERQRIARELHDEVGQSLTAVLLTLKRTVDRAPPDLQDELQSMQELIRSTLDEVRHIARRLRPGVLEDLGLASALHALTTEFTQLTGLRADLRLDPQLPPLTPDAELVLYRIAQEGLTNVARHADASRVELSLTPRDGFVELCLIDDGRGINGAPQGTGIHGMRERALLVDARLTIQPATPAGTAVRVVLPLPCREGIPGDREDAHPAGR